MFGFAVHYKRTAKRKINIVRFWDTYKYHPNVSVSTFQVKVAQGHKMKKSN